MCIRDRVLEGGLTVNQMPKQEGKVTVSAEDIKRVKAWGFLHNKGTDCFNARIITRNGKITLSGVTSQNVAATIQNSGTLKLENISANVCDAKVQNGSITGSVIGSGSSYGFELAAGGGKIRVSDASDKNFLFFGKDTLQQNADAPNKLNLATKNGDVEVEFVR